MQGVPDTPPLPEPADEARRRQSRLRRRIVSGVWKDDLERKCRQFFPGATVERFGTIDTSRNLLRVVTRQLAVRYTRPWRIDAEGADLDQLDAALRDAGAMGVLTRNNRLTAALREGLVRVDWIDGGLSLRAVPADLVAAWPDSDDPTQPIRVVEARVRTLDLGKGPAPVWTWDLLDVSDPSDPIWRVLVPGEKATLATARDVTALALGVESASGDAYPWRVEGRGPVLPYVLYHAEGGTGRLWDTWENRELVDGTLQTAALWTFWAACVRDCSYSKIFGVNVEAEGAIKRGSGTSIRRELHVDPSAITFFRDKDAPGSGRFMQFGAAVDPERLQLAIQSYEQATLMHSGLGADDFQRSGAAQSGYAISLRREVVRARQREADATYSRSDVQLLAICAALLNANAGANLPEAGYVVHYQGVPLSPDERAARLAAVISKAELGMASPVDVVLAEHPDLTRAEAAAMLETIREERRLFSDFLGAAT